MKLDSKSVPQWKKEISGMSQIELATLRRFAPAGHIVFTNDELTEHFNECFAAKGGMTPDISKRIGWGEPRE